MTDSTLIVIPAYNEEQTLPQVVASLAELPPAFEILIVDDGSTDDTGRIAAEMAARRPPGVHVLRLADNGGIGVAMQAGFMFAERHGRFRYVVQFDADGQHDADCVEDLVRACADDDLDLCVGSRFVEAGPEQFRSTPARRVGIRFLAWLIGALSGTAVSDPTSGFRCYGPRAWRRFASRYPEDYPEPEALFWCVRHGLRISEIPVRMHARRGGASSIQRAAAAYYMLKVSLAIIIDRIRMKELQK